MAHFDHFYTTSFLAGQDGLTRTTLTTRTYWWLIFTKQSDKIKSLLFNSNMYVFLLFQERSAVIFHLMFQMSISSFYLHTLETLWHQKIIINKNKSRRKKNVIHRYISTAEPSLEFIFRASDNLQSSSGFDFESRGGLGQVVMQSIR